MEGSIYSLLPPVTAIVICILFRQAIVALFIGVVVGAALLSGLNPMAIAQTTFVDIMGSTVQDRDNIVNLCFTTIIGGVVGILNYSPSSMRLLNHIGTFLHNRARTCVVIWFSGLLFFIDDYANSLIIGNTYRKVADRFYISREKLAFIVDTTSAPIASLALVSTWIGFEISVIGDALEASNVDTYTGYGLFLTSIPYRFYPLLAIFFCLMVCWMQKDYGAMLRAEQRVISDPVSIPETGKKAKEESEEEEKPPFRPVEWLILVPLAVLIVVSISYMFLSGIMSGADIRTASILYMMIDTLSNADAFMALLVAAITASIVSFIIHTLLIKESSASVIVNWLKGCRTMLIIDVILILAWSIGDVCGHLETGEYVATLFHAGFDPHFLPLLTFLCAAGISFATGTSYGTMSILMPVAVPVVVAMGMDDPAIMYGTVGSVLGGAIFGDHCSPLSDTTILSSGASGCEVTAHVNTQLPYALTVAFVSSVCLLMVPLKTVSTWIILPAGMVVLALFLYWYGRRPLVNEETADLFE